MSVWQFKYKIIPPPWSTCYFSMPAWLFWNQDFMPVSKVEALFPVRKVFFPSCSAVSISLIFIFSFFILYTNFIYGISQPHLLFLAPWMLHCNLQLLWYYFPFLASQAPVTLTCSLLSTIFLLVFSVDCAMPFSYRGIPQIGGMLQVYLHTLRGVWHTTYHFKIMYNLYNIKKMEQIIFIVFPDQGHVCYFGCVYCSVYKWLIFVWLLKQI